MIKNGIYRNYQKDIKEFERLYRDFLEGRAFESDFKNFRLTNGIYGQRQKDFYMVRIKIPAGVLTPQQIYEIADIGDEFSNGVAHITTRQDIQYHWVKLENISQIIKRINEIGLTTKDACGNTLRNITASYLSGVCPDEIIEVGRVAQKITELLIGKYENLPRKFKIGFACCEKHSFLVPFNDIGFLPVLYEGRPAFRAFLGGGLGDRPKYPYEYPEIVRLEELILFIRSVMDLFDKHGDRKNKRHNRLKFLIQKIGIDEFLRLLKEQIEENKNIYPQFDCDAVYVETGKVDNPLPKAVDEDMDLWLKTNLIPQKQKDLFVVLVKLHLGNITTGKLREIGKIAEELSLSVRTTQDQNIAFVNVHRNSIQELYNLLKNAGLSEYGASTFLDITACPGSETCSLGITSSRDLSRAIYEKLPKDRETVEKLKGITIKISGCPNSCAHHHVASIGLHGIAVKENDTLIPAYVLHIGGNGSINREKIGYTGLKIPAKNVPEAVLELLRFYLKNSKDGESFEDFVERVEPENIFKHLEKYRKLQEGVDYQFDWGSDKQFSLEDLGTGECAGIIADRVEEALKEGERLLKQAETHLEKGQPEDAAVHVEKAVDIISSGLLIPFGVKAEGKDAREKFIEQIIGRKLVNERFLRLIDNQIKDYYELVQEGKEFYKESKEAYLRLRRETEEKKDKKEEKARKEFLDLRGVECPFNYVKAKYKLREMDIGSILVITIDGEESIRSVPQSLRDDGHEIIDIQETGDGVYNVIVRKR
ncbi:sulfite reductase (ferredoxin) [Persephonella hydrogeniphila]|uniref:Sulfite reductase (Ferredoxin) n=1 Tax=Persephonella hydrogeniphila TaxID=198703 RepID=A0A285NPL0_9AQUI|nr:sulfurtransferase TusA family protein [Persephonella hydrogeniphila]SNZ11452.1 sulfite reductase (ferredoxin) [Persephonella hydrogeniphila]